jgi:hypothetical protein
MSTGGGTGSPIVGVAGGVGSVLPIAVSGSSRGDLRAELARNGDPFGFVSITNRTTPPPGGQKPDDTKLWAVLQSASGGTWRGCIYDSERIAARLSHD